VECAKCSSWCLDELLIIEMRRVVTTPRISFNLPLPPRIMHVVSGFHRLRLAAIVAACAVLAVGLLPPEHLHGSLASDGHAEDIVHRHFEPHHRTHALATIDHPDDDVQWLASTFTVPQRDATVQGPAVVAEYDVPPSPPKSTSRAIGQILFVSVHDPPWATSSGLRAPPISRL